MDLHLYPRPPEDTGIGVQWCAGASQAPLSVVRSFWIPELQELGVKWVHLNDHRGAEPLVEELLAEDIMPVVRIHRAAPNPNRLRGEELAAVESLIRSGARYIEFNRRPDRPQTWHRGVLPPRARQLVLEHLIFDLEAILIRGGCPGLPAVDPTSSWDFVADLVRLGRDDLLDGMIWQAVYNPPLNRPPDFPEDPVQQEGAPVDASVFRRLAEESKSLDPWQGRSRADINRLRWEAAWATGQNRAALGLPDSRIHFQSYQQVDERNQKTLGRSLPLLSVPSGYLIENGEDPRYPVVTPLLHMAYTLEVCRMMMGSSLRFPPAVDAYFCTALPMLANRALASDRPARERDAWYSDEWPERTLPIVLALKAEPKQVRVGLSPALENPTTGAEEIKVSDAMELATSFDDQPSGPGVVQGNVAGGAGAGLRLVRQEDGFCLMTVARANGVFRFTGLPSGHYTVWVQEPAGSRVEGVFLPPPTDEEPTPIREVELAVYGWGYTVSEDEGGRGVLACSVALTPDLAGTLSVRINGPGADNHVITLARSRGRAAGESPPLLPGDYTLELLGIPDVSPAALRAYAGVVRGRRTVVHYQFSRRHARPVPAQSRIHGRVVNGAGCHVRLLNEAGSAREAWADEKGSFTFEDLPPGVYSIIAGREGRQVHKERIGLDGRNRLTVELHLPSAKESISRIKVGTLMGAAVNAPGRAAILAAPEGMTWIHRVDEQGRFRFERIPPGVYTLIVGDAQRRGVMVQPGETVRIIFS